VQLLQAGIFRRLHSAVVRQSSSCQELCWVLPIGGLILEPLGHRPPANFGLPEGLYRLHSCGTQGDSTCGTRGWQRGRGDLIPCGHLSASASHFIGSCRDPILPLDEASHTNAIAHLSSHSIEQDQYSMCVDFYPFRAIHSAAGSFASNDQDLQQSTTNMMG
jgi:hypothetical protein